MKQQFLEKWVRPVVQSPKTTISALAALLVLFLPHHSAVIASAAAAIGLMFAGDANQTPKQ